MRKIIFVPLALVAAFALTASTADAGPVHTPKAFFGPRVVVGGGVNFHVPLRAPQGVRPCGCASRRVLADGAAAGLGARARDWV